MNFDVIGDVHGHAEELAALLRKLGYRPRSGAWRHPERRVIFVGDLIDRGPKQLDTLTMVRDMVEAGAARAVMGNHELNAIAWSTLDPREAGHFLRPRHGTTGQKNREQHRAFLDQIGEGDQKGWINWFLDLPLWIEEPELRVVHACWSEVEAAKLLPHIRDGKRLTMDLVVRASRKSSDLHQAIETLLKGVEVELPDGCSFRDKGGHVRRQIRTRWWDPNLRTYRAAYIGPTGADIPDVTLPLDKALPPPDRPTFIGHYWFEADAPLAPASDLVACVDYSVANGGPLVAYRFDGESRLTADKFVAVHRKRMC